ncbi:hypothetical protein NM688_g4102 [Phlebia brevispora]|uniref:Uncharacterized protein n=1 Tax=Phlebia brevispora TaxID=194682 RepID=A0ACC1T415_9APHY|nr:hypothetical protein NM688_g4102 [Phlebia brevispora]
MSAPSAAEVAAIIAEYNLFHLTNYGVYAVTALAFYEYIITFKHEYHLFWKRKWSSATWILIASRYSMLAVAITLLAPANAQVWRIILRSVYYLADTYFSCRYHTNLLQTFAALVEALPSPVVVSAFSFLRVFALLDRNYYVSTFVLLLDLVPIPIAAILIHNTAWQYVDSPVLGSACYGLNTLDPSTILQDSFPVTSRTTLITFTVNLISVVTPIVADVTVLGVTFYKTYHHIKQASSVGIRVGLSEALLKNGSLCFVALLVISIISLLLDLVPALQNGNPLGVLTQILPYVLVSRFLINLRQVDSPNMSERSVKMDRFSQFSMPNFHVPTINDFVGNMGESLEYGAADEVFEDATEVMGSTDEVANIAGGSEGPSESASTLNIEKEGIQEVPKDAMV